MNCKGRGVFPSCNGRHRAQTAAHLANHVIPPVPVRRLVISVPKRVRGFLTDRPAAVAEGRGTASQNPAQQAAVRSGREQKQARPTGPKGLKITASCGSLRNPAKPQNGEGGILSGLFSTVSDCLRFLTQYPCPSTTCDRWLVLERSGPFWAKSGPFSTVSAKFSEALLEMVALSALGFGKACCPAIVPPAAAKGGAS